MGGTEAVRRHVAHMKRRGLRPNTILLRTRVLRRLEIHANKPLLRINLDDIRAFIDRLDDTGSRAAETTQIRGFFQWAAREGYVPIDPTIRLEPIRKRKYLPRPVPEDDLDRILEDPPERIHNAIWLAAYAGLRACDLSGLRVEHLMIDRTPGIVFVEESKGGKPRTVPLSIELIGELRLPRSGWLFPRMDATPGPTPPHLISQLGNRHIRSLGLPYKFHQLRHTAITQWYRVNRDLVVVQGLAGHESITTTRGYTWTDPAAAAKTVEAVRVRKTRLRAVV